MGATVLVIVLVGAGESGSDWAAGMLQTMREALDRSVVIDVRERGEAGAPPEDAYVVTVDFAAEKLKAHLTPLQPTGRAAKDVSFKRSDRTLDRGRSIGYALAALLPELKPDAVGPEVAVAASTPTLHLFVPVSDYIPGPPVIVERPAPPPSIIIQTTPGRAALEVAGYGGGSGVAGLAGGLSVTAEVGLGKGLALRGGGFGLFGASPLAGADLRRLGARGGFRFTALARGPVALSILGHIAALRLEMTRADETEGRWLPAAQGGLELAVGVSRLAFFVTPSFQWSFGPTGIYVRNVEVASVPERLYLLEIGLRWWP